MDSQYLKTNVGDALSEGLSQVIIKSPPDPIDYLSQFLIKFVANRHAKTANEGQAPAFERAQAEVDARKAQAASVKLEASVEASSRERDESQFVKLCTSAPRSTDILDSFAELLKKRVHATGVYIGEVETAAEARRVHYIAATEDHAFMVDQVLAEPALTFESIAVPSAEEGEAAADGEPAAEPKPYEPKAFLVSNVLLGDTSDKVRFFRGRKNVGSFAAIHVEYGTLLHEAAIVVPEGQWTLPIVPAEPKPQQQTQSADPSAAEPAGAEASAEPVAAIPEPPRISRHLIIAFDTLGQSHEIRSADLLEAKRLCIVLRSGLLDTDQRAFLLERQWRDADRSSASPVGTDRSAETADMQASFKEDTLWINERVQFGLAQADVVRQMDQIVKLAKLTCPPGPSSILLAILHIASVVINKERPVHKYMTERVVEALRAVNPIAEGAFDVGSVAELIGEQTVETVQSVSTLYGTLLNFAKTALILAQTAITHRKELAEAAAAQLVAEQAAAAEKAIADKAAADQAAADQAAAAAENQAAASEGKPTDNPTA